jgi:hypothetical protein
MQRIVRLLAGTCLSGTLLAAMPALAQQRAAHVLLISVDGLHAADLARYVADPAHAGSALTALSRRGMRYPNAYTTAPSDSFPGLLAQVTGGTPYSTGVFYDDSFDRTFFAAGSNCTGTRGVETNYAENIDHDSSQLTGGGTLGLPLTQIDPAKLPMTDHYGICQPVYPHDFVRVNTLFEVVRAHGGYTAWADKHPAYDILNGPSGHGVADLFTPEVDSLIPGTTTLSTTKSFAAVRANDEVKVGAVLNEIAGRTSTGTRAAPVPTVFGLDFQSVSVGQKLAISGPTDPAGLVGGYSDAATPGNALAGQLDYVDGAIGRMVAALRARDLARSTLVIVSAKHGQSPIDRTTRVAVDDAPYAATPGYAFHIADDEALVWLDPARSAASRGAAESYLVDEASVLRIDALAGRAILRLFYRDPATDSRTPDFIAVSAHGVIYTGGTKLAEHGGFSRDDRNVALLVSGPGVGAGVSDAVVQTTQIAPTILAALGLEPDELDAVRRERTATLPGLGR